MAASLFDAIDAISDLSAAADSSERIKIDAVKSAVSDLAYRLEAIERILHALASKAALTADQLAQPKTDSQSHLDRAQTRYGATSDPAHGHVERILD